MKPNPSADRHAYIPPSIEKAMSASLPTHLQQYVGNDRPSYVPPQIQKQLNQQLQKMPAHMKQYAGAYMQQRVVQPNFNRSSSVQPNRVATDLPSRPPTPNPLKLDHSMPFGEQQTVKINTMAPNQTTAPPPGNDYGFILSPEESQKSSPFGFLNGGNSMAKKLVVLAVGAVVLIVLIIIFASVFLGSKTNSQALISLTQQQNELIRVAGEATNEAVNQPVKNLAVNTQLSLTTDQGQIIAFLSQHHKKVDSKQLALTKNSNTDQQLTEAQASSNFDMVYIQITQNSLKSYLQNLKQTYNSTTDPGERQMLSQEYSNASILLSEANSAAQSLSAN